MAEDTTRRAGHPVEATRQRRRASGLLRSLRSREWSTLERLVFISALASAFGALFVASYSLALGDPVPHRIEAALVGNPAGHRATVGAVQKVADGALVFQRYDSVDAGLHALDEQDVYAVLDLASNRPTLYLASAAGASVARMLEQTAVVDRSVRVVDAHPLPAHDPNGLDIFYLMLAATIVGFITIFQIRVNLAGSLPVYRWSAFVGAFGIGAALVFTLVDGPVLHRLDLPLLESWGILTLQLVSVASFASLMLVAVGRWAIVPTWLFFVILGNSSSGGAVAPPLLPPPFDFLSQWLPSGATVTALREAVYFPDYQHARPIAVLAAWAVVLFVGMVLLSLRRRTSPGGP